MTGRMRLLLATFALVTAVAIVLFVIGALAAHLTDPAPLHIDERQHDAHVVIDVDRTNVVLWTDCISISWRVGGVKSLYLNETGYPGVDSQSVCGTDATLLMTFFDGGTTTYDVTRYVALAEPSANLLMLALAGLFAWAGIWLLGRIRMSPHEAAAHWLDLFFRPVLPGTIPRWLTAIVLGALFALGAAHWISFFNRGQVALISQDWALEQHYWEVMSRAAETHQLPFFIDGGTRNTDNFLGNPETTLTPFLLFSTLSPGQRALLTTLAVYVVGFAGTALIRRRYRLSLLTTSILFLLLNFNGFVTSHIGVGHFMYLSALLLPFFVLPLLRLAENSTSQTRAGLEIGLVLFAMELLGGYNFLVWCGEMLVLFALVNPTRWRGVLIAAVSGLGLTAVRVLPAMLTFGGQPHPFLVGFPTPNTLFDSLATLQNIGFLSGMNGGLSRLVYRGVPWWEFDMYVGLIGLAFVVVGGVALRFAPAERFSRLRCAGLDVPILVMALLAMGDFYKYIATLPLPLVNVDRNASRILIVPLTILIVLAAIRFEALLPSLMAGWKHKLALLAGLWLLASNLMLHSQMWSLVEIERRHTDPFVSLPSDVIIGLGQKALGLGDKLYVLSVPIGLAITLSAGVAWVWFYRRSRREPVSSASMA